MVVFAKVHGACNGYNFEYLEVFKRLTHERELNFVQDDGQNFVKKFFVNCKSSKKASSQKSLVTQKNRNFMKTLVTAQKCYVACLILKFSWFVINNKDLRYNDNNYQELYGTLWQTDSEQNGTGHFLEK